MGIKVIKGFKGFKGLGVMMVQRQFAARDWVVSGKCVNRWREWDAAADRCCESRSIARRREAQAEAAALCAGCPVAAQCLNDAVESGERWTVRGGLPVWRLRQLAASLKAGSRAPLNVELALMAANQAPSVSWAA